MESVNSKIPLPDFRGVLAGGNTVDKEGKKQLKTGSAKVCGKVAKSINDPHPYCRRTKKEEPAFVERNKQLELEASEKRNIKACIPDELGRSDGMYHSAFNIESKVEKPGINSFSICKENTTAADCSERQIKLYHSKHSNPEAAMLSDEQVEMLFQQIFSDGEICSLSKADISADRKPKWFQSRWAWKVICLFDSAIRNSERGVDLNAVINQIEKNDPCFRFILSSTFCLDSGSLANHLSLGGRSKDIIPLWLRYSLAGEGFDVSGQWLDHYLRTPSDNQWMSMHIAETLQFKFSEGYPGNEETCDSGSGFSKPGLKAIGMKPEHIGIDSKPASMPYSLWLMVVECSHWLNSCRKRNIKPLSAESSRQFADLAFLKALLQRFFSVYFDAEVTTRLMDTRGKTISYNPLAWERLRVELMLDRLGSNELYPDFSNWRGWLMSGKSAR